MSRSYDLGPSVMKHHTALKYSFKNPMVLGFQLNKQENKRGNVRISEEVQGKTDEGAKSPVTCRTRLLAAWCARCTRCTRCGVS